MDYEVKILVSEYNGNGVRKELYRRCVLVTSCNPLPWSDVVAVLRRLYPNKIIEFIINV